jgi:FtsP/CotA-like multicopper oxidase with cupredoxin domain
MFQWSLTMKEGLIDLPAQELPIYTWGYEDIKGFRAPGTLLQVTEGEPVELIVTNDLWEYHNFSVLGTSINVSIGPGQTQVITFTAPPSGTYIYGDFTNPLNRALGLCGGMISMPPDITNSLLTGGPMFERQYFWLLTSIDSTWNKAVQNRLPVNTAIYRPNYFFINGLAHPESMMKMSMPEMPDIEGLMIHERLNASIQLRIANASLVPHSIHWHGFHIEQLTKNRSHLSQYLVKDNILVSPQATTDVMLTFDKTGKYMTHDHILMSLTANGVYPNGALTMFEIMKEE